MAPTPRPYQNLLVDHMEEYPRGYRGAGMGMGKTFATMYWLEGLYLTGRESQPSLVLAPKRVAQSTWPDEQRKWRFPNIGVRPIIGEAEARIAALRDTNASVFTMNYENLPWLIEHLAIGRKAWPFKIVTPDEGTRLKNYRGSEQVSSLGNTFIRNAGGKRARALADVAHKHATHFNILSGTPAPNGLKDLWGQVWFVDKGLALGRTYGGFIQRWFRPDPSGYGSIPLAHAEAEIRAALRGPFITLNAKDWFDLREPKINTIYVELPAGAMRHYKEMEKKMFTEIEGNPIEAFNAASRTIKCLQLANGAAYLEPDVQSDDDSRARQWKEVHDVKLQALESVVEEAGGMPVLVAYHFKSDLARLLRHFPQGRVLDDDPETIRAWNEGRVPLLFAHPASAGHGLNLQDGSNIIAFFGLWWDLELHQQIIERIGPTRQAQSGHDRVVFVHYIVARGTVDELVLRRLESKANVQSILMEAMKAKK
jgi:SNF2 family DNA or RNA helicase